MEILQTASHVQSIVATPGTDGVKRRLWVVYSALNPTKHASVVDYILNDDLPVQYNECLTVLPSVHTSAAHFDHWANNRVFSFYKRYGVEHDRKVASVEDRKALCDYYGSGISHIQSIKGPNSTGQIQNIMYVMYAACNAGIVKPVKMVEYTVVPGGKVEYPDPPGSKNLIFFDQIRTIRRYYDFWQYRQEFLQG